MNNSVDSESGVARQDRLIKGLLSPRAYPHPVACVEHIETHISHILLAGDYAYKLKKPLDLGFLDFSTLERRRFCCDEELRLNRRLAPRMYRRVVPITGTRERPRIGPEQQGKALEFAVKMRRFDQDKLLTQMPVTRSLADRIAKQVAGFHAAIPAAEETREFGTPEAVLLPMLENFEQIRTHLRDSEALAKLQPLERWTRKQRDELWSVLKQRKSGGYVRECHGDIHRGNIALVDGKVVIFDGIEFNPALRWIDTMSDVAFLVMDLEEAGQEDRARRFLNRYLEISGDYRGLLVLDFYKVYRAMVRAKVTAIRLGQPDVDSAEAARDGEAYGGYVALAQSYTNKREKRLILTHGVSGAGKSRLAMLLRERLPLVHIRSDIERKRLFGLPELARTDAAQGGGIYAEEAGDRTYERLRELASQILDAGYSPLVDASFLSASRRAAFFDLAREKGCSCTILDLTAPPEVLRRRVEVREEKGEDPSEAGAAVLRVQLIVSEPLTQAEQARTISIDTHRPPKLEALLEMIRTAE